MNSLFAFLAAFLFMEWAAWAAHKYLMHGFLWALHEDHHAPYVKIWQKNDLFAFFFAVPSFLSILYGTQWGPSWVAALGFGVMAYGFVYFTVHEVVIHRRYKFFRGRGWYFRALIHAHRDHHRVHTKEGTENFGMLWVPLKYFHSARQLLQDSGRSSEPLGSRPS